MTEDWHFRQLTNRTGAHLPFIVVHSSENNSWSKIRPKDDDSTIRGEIFSVIQTNDGTIFAVGHQFPSISNAKSAPIGFSEILLLRSKDGQKLNHVPLTDGGKKIYGGLQSIVRRTDGGLVAVGHEYFAGKKENPTEYLIPRVLFLYSDKGEEWEIIRPTKGIDGESLLGGIRDVVETSKRNLVAVGFGYLEAERTGVFGRMALRALPMQPRTRKVMILHSDDGKKWAQVGDEDQSNDIFGQLNGVILTRKGGLLAAGAKHSSDSSFSFIQRNLPVTRSEPLVLHLDSGTAWREVGWSANGEGIFGEIFSLVESPDETIIGVGRRDATGAPRWKTDISEQVQII